MEGMLGFNLLNAGIKTAAMLFIVLGLLILVLYVMKRFLPIRRGTRGELFIKVLSSLYLSPKERIEVIEIAGERIVLGVTPGRINLLARLGDPKDEKRTLDEEGKGHAIRE